ncbi:flavodoxin domain-containing protein [Candidatus Lokiarchaeum ossiferum]|uniref:flavodoxin domain-containing protein n=1 Tax=Candidatus Lokiarchaeum ossiferum TaxID=2951803 RepID=UPI00352C3EA6
MKIAILYDSKFGNTKEIAEFLTAEGHTAGHETQLFRTTKTKPLNLIAFQPEAIMVGGPTHFGKPASTLKKYVKKLGKISGSSSLRKAAVFNCYTEQDVSKTIKDQISNSLPNINVFEQSFTVITGDGSGDNWNRVLLPVNWKDGAKSFLSAFLTFKFK